MRKAIRTLILSFPINHNLRMRKSLRSISRMAVLIVFVLFHALIALHAAPPFVQQARLTAFDREQNDDFGQSVGISGDTMIISAHGDDLDPDND